MDYRKYSSNALWIGMGSLFFCIMFIFSCVRDPFSAMIPSGNYYDNKLIFTKYFNGALINSNTKFQNAIYILGGSHHNLEKKFRIAADLYRKNLACKIIIMSEPGITVYSAYLNRNLSNDEWANEELIRLGIRKGDIEAVTIRKGYFGTYSEASGVSELVSKRNYKALILVTSRYHTRRTWESFSALLKNHDVKIYVYDSYESIPRREAIVEYIKLKIYEYILLKFN